MRLSARIGPEWLALVATASLTAFYYGVRADAIGVLPARGVWTPMTGAPVPPILHFAGALALLAIVPLAAARRLTGLGFRGLGLGLGRVKQGLILLALGIPLVILGAFLAARSPWMQSVYPLGKGIGAAPERFLPYAATEFLYYGSWEVLFRGVLLFGLRNRLGATGANLLQTALSVTAHFGRPLEETAAAIPGGILFGWLDLKLGSIWYVAALHWILGAGVDWFVLAGVNR